MLLSAVRVREVRVVGSDVRIENSVIRSEGTALRLVGSRVTLTGGNIEGRVAVIVEDSHLDIAGTTLNGEQAAVRVPEGSTPEDKVTVLFSVSRVESPETSGYVHGPRTIGPRRPL